LVKSVQVKNNIEINTYQADAFYEDLVRSLRGIEYPSVSIAREILIAMCCSWLRGRGIRVTPKNCAALINMISPHKRYSRDISDEYIDRLIKSTVLSLCPKDSEKCNAPAPEVRPSGGSVCPVCEIEGVGKLIAPGSPDGPFVLELISRTIVFENLDHFTSFLNRLWDTATTIESISMRRKPAIPTHAYALQVIGELEEDFRNLLSNDSEQETNCSPSELQDAESSQPSITTEERDADQDAAWAREEEQELIDDDDDEIQEQD